MLDSRIAITESKVNCAFMLLHASSVLDNLKKLGNMVLNPFGLSTDNFNFVKDEDTGSYKVNFNKQPS